MHEKINNIKIWKFLLSSVNKSLEILINGFKNPSVSASYGRQIPCLDATGGEKVMRAYNYPETSTLKTEDDIPEMGLHTPFCSNSFAAYRKADLLKIGGFPKTDFGEDMEMIAKKLSLKIMTENGTEFSDKTHIQRIDGRTVYADREEKPVIFEDVDLIVVSAGMASVDELSAELGGAVSFHLVGDARQVGNAEDAITDAHQTCSRI